MTVIPCQQNAELRKHIEKFAETLTITALGTFKLPPACIYVLPSKVGGVTHAPARTLLDVELLEAFHKAFNGQDNEVNLVDFDIDTTDGEISRKTVVRRAQIVQRESDFSPIRRA